MQDQITVFTISPEDLQAHKRLDSFLAQRFPDLSRSLIKKLFQDKQAIEQFGDLDFSYAFSRIESHYFYHGGFFETDNWILENIEKKALK